MKGARPVPVERNHRFRPGSRLSSSSVPTGLRPISTSSPFTMFWRREVSGPSCTLIERNSSVSSQGGEAME